MIDERIKPFVRYMTEEGANGEEGLRAVRDESNAHHTHPVIVTPLLPDDPKVGEVWATGGERPVTILSAPAVDRDGEDWYETSEGYFGRLSLKRIPATKTYRLKGSDVTITAESKEAAAAQIVDSLIEEES